LGYLSGTTTSARIGGFFAANFATGPGLTGWLMTAILIIMTVFAMDEQKKKKYERFFYSHHLFIGFFALWQLHGLVCSAVVVRESTLLIR
jgi:multisubunit Na+/H+ antiporter MnhB subunit